MYTVVDSSFFNLQFDNVHFIKLRQCTKNICGICGNNNGNMIDDIVDPNIYLANRKKAGCLAN